MVDYLKIFGVDDVGSQKTIYKESSYYFHLKKLYMVCTLPSFKITIIIIKINNKKNKNTIKT